MPWLRGGMQINSEDADFGRSQAVSAPGNAEEATRDRAVLGSECNEGLTQQAFKSKDEEHTCWTISIQVD